jgi:hypothetical protein
MKILLEGRGGGRGMAVKILVAKQHILKLKVTRCKATHFEFIPYSKCIHFLTSLAFRPLQKPESIF